MKKIEEVTCIKFDNGNKQNHQELLYFSKSNTRSLICKVNDRCWFLKNETCNKDFIEFRHGLGCYSLAGRDGGRQGIVLASYCAEEHTLIHEVHISERYILMIRFLDSACLGSFT